MAPRRIRLQLLAGLLLPLGLVALVEFLVAYRTAEATTQRVTDSLLLASARSIGENVTFGANGPEAIVPPEALGMFDFGYGDRVYYRVLDARGTLLAGYPDLPEPPAKPAPGGARYVDTVFRDEPVRLVSILQDMPSPHGIKTIRVAVAETLRGRNAMSRDLWLSSGTQQLLLVLLACTLAWFALRRAFAPIIQLGVEVRDRRPSDFRPFAVEALQAEFEPLIVALNGYMLRLRAQLDAQRRFTANAAHQLRTPLALLHTQATYAQRSPNDVERSEATRAIVGTTRQLTRMTNQLLALAKAEPQGTFARREAIDLAEMTRRVLEEYGSLAVERGIDLSFDAHDGPARLEADPSEARDLIVNLVDNALRYTPSGGRVAVRVARDDGFVDFRVEDDGPGIPDALRGIVYERFFRVPGSEAEGSGLGLAIVKEIVDAHGGTIELRDGAEGRGLLAIVRLPAVGRAPRSVRPM